MVPFIRKTTHFSETSQQMTISDYPELGHVTTNCKETRLAGLQVSNGRQQGKRELGMTLDSSLGSVCFILTVIPSFGERTIISEKVDLFQLRPRKYSIMLCFFWGHNCFVFQGPASFPLEETEGRQMVANTQNLLSSFSHLQILTLPTRLFDCSCQCLYLFRSAHLLKI